MSDFGTRTRCRNIICNLKWRIISGIARLGVYGFGVGAVKKYWDQVRGCKSLRPKDLGGVS